MDRRQFNKTVATGIIGASFLPAADVKADDDHPGVKTTYLSGTSSVEELVGKRTLKPGEHIFGGLIDGKQPIAAFYYPHQTVYSWLWRLNYQYIAPNRQDPRLWTARPHEWQRNPSGCRYHGTFVPLPQRNAFATPYPPVKWVDLVWTDHWKYYGTKHIKLSPHTQSAEEPGNSLVYMQDDLRNCLFWKPNSHRGGVIKNKPSKSGKRAMSWRVSKQQYGGNESPSSTTLHIWDNHISRRPFKQIFKKMPYPTDVYGVQKSLLAFELIGGLG